MTGPLAGLRVLDLSRVLAGPYCTMLLADLGADVLKIEPPDGDPTRTYGPFLPDDNDPAFGGYFQSINRNKSSISLDLTRPDGQRILRELARGADVLVENFRVGTMERWGLAYESLREDNPALVYACIRGFGDPRTGASPYADWPAFDITAQAMGGLMGITGVDRPTKCGPGVGDVFPAVLAAVGILAALRHAAATGEGQLVDVAMYDGVLSLCERIVHQYRYTGEVPGPQGNSHPLFVPFDVFPTADGWVTIAALVDKQWRELCVAMGHDALGRDPRYATTVDRARHREEITELITEWTSGLPTADVVAALGGLVPCGPVNTAADIAADPHVAVREMIVPVEHPGAEREVAVAGVPVKLSATPGEVRRRAPLLGEHTDEVLGRLGYTGEQVRRLRTEGIVR